MDQKADLDQKIDMTLISSAVERTYGKEKDGTPIISGEDSKV